MVYVERVFVTVSTAQEAEMAAPMPCSPLGGGLHHREVLIPSLLPKPQAACSAVPCIPGSHGTCYPQRACVPSRKSHSGGQWNSKSQRCHRQREMERSGVGHRGRYTMPLPSDTSLKLPAAGPQAGFPAGPALVPSASESSGGPAGAL